MNVRIVLPIEVYGKLEDRKAVAAWLQRVLAPRIAGIQVTQRRDSGIVITANYLPADSGLGAIEAAASILELVYQGLEGELLNRRRRPSAATAIQRHLNAVHFANIDVRP